MYKELFPENQIQRSNRPFFVFYFFLYMKTERKSTINFMNYSYERYHYEF